MKNTPRSSIRRPSFPSAAGKIAAKWPKSRLIGRPADLRAILRSGAGRADPEAWKEAEEAAEVEEPKEASPVG